MVKQTDHIEDLKMLQFRLKRVIIRSDAETQRVSIVCPDGAQYVIQFTTDDADHFHEFEAYLLWNAMHYSDFRDEERTLLVIREVEHYALICGVSNMNIKYLIHKETSIVYSKEYYEEHKDNIDLTEFYAINGN